MSDQLQKRDAGKFDPLMIEEDLARALAVCNAVLEFGKEKYGQRGGWMQVDIGRYKSAGARHRREVMLNGIADRDEETNLLHKAHEVINGLFEIEMYLKGKKLGPYLDYRKPVPVTKALPSIVDLMPKQEQQFQNVPDAKPIYSYKQRMAAKLNGDPQPDAQPSYLAPLDSDK